MNDLSIRLIARTDAWLNSFTHEEEGSQALEAAGAALAAAAIVVLLRGGAKILGDAVKTAFENATKAIQ